MYFKTLGCWYALYTQSVAMSGNVSANLGSSANMRLTFLSKIILSRL